MASAARHSAAHSAYRRGNHAAAALLLCCWLATLTSPAAAQRNLVGASPARSPPPVPEPKFPLIVIFREQKSLAKLRMMCNASTLVYRTFSRSLGLPFDCHMPGQCKRIYSTAVTGLAGDFTNADLAKLERCLPGSIFYKELDGTVHKAEDDGFWHPAEEPEHQHRQQQQQQRAQHAQQVQRTQQVSQAEHAALRRRLAPPGKNRRMQQVDSGLPPVQELPRVVSFEERVRTPASEDTAINLWNLTQGHNMNLPGEKQQWVSSRLWNLDRMDQRELPLNGVYTYGTALSNGTGEGTTIYVVDSGIKLDHQEFKNDLGTQTRAFYGFDFVEDDAIADDCDGHGTHVSATAVGLQVGVAKEANVVAVRILDCTGSGTISDTVAGLDWVAASHKKPAVVTLSLGIQVGSWSRVLEDAVRTLATVHGVTVVVASGNSGVDACYVAPANVPEVITVAASNVATKYNGTRAGDTEDIYRWSNTGPCVDMFAPGVDIYSACGGQSRCQVVDNMSYTFASGTSMAVPHVAGVAAIYLSANPTATPQQVSSILTSTATPNKVNPARFKSGTPNRLLYSKLDQEVAVSAANGP